MALNKEQLKRAIEEIKLKLVQLSKECFFNEVYLCGSACKKNATIFNDIDFAFKFTKENLLRYKNKVDCFPPELNRNILYAYDDPLRKFLKKEGNIVFWENYGIYRQFLIYQLEQIHPIKPVSHYCVIIIADNVIDPDFTDGLRRWEDFKKQAYVKLFPA